MITTRLYQTVENRENPDEVERNAPFKCVSKNAWLGKGYYFWDTFDAHAHKWGEVMYRGNYFICEVLGRYHREEVLDLVGNTDQINDVGKVAQTLEKEYGASLTVPFIIEYLKRKTPFDFKMIRAHSEDAFSVSDRIIYQFVPNKRPYINLRPIIQCCVIDKSILRLPVKIVYPPEYVEVSCI